MASQSSAKKHFLSFTKNHVFSVVIFVVVAVTLVAAFTIANLQAESGRTSSGNGANNSTDSAVKIESNTTPQDGVSPAPNSQGDDNKANQTDTTVTINGEEVEVPESGTVHKDIPNNNGSTSVDVSVDNNSSGGNTTKSGGTIRVQANSHSTSRIIDNQNVIQKGEVSK